MSNPVCDHTEKRLSEFRQKMRDAAQAGNAHLARAYGEEVLYLLKRRDPECVAAEEKEKGIL